METHDRTTSQYTAETNESLDADAVLEEQKSTGDIPAEEVLAASPDPVDTDQYSTDPELASGALEEQHDED